MTTGVHASAALDDAMAIRRAGRELLSLALMDARNHLLARLALDETPSALRIAAHAGWYQEHWISGHVQRSRGEGCAVGSVRLAGVEPRIAAWLAPESEPPTPEQVRGYLANTLEITLELLATTPDEDAPLHFYRQALLHEDRLCEALDEGGRRGQPPVRVQHEPLWLPARRWTLGSEPGTGGYVPLLERWAHPVAVPECEIDAQAVNWAQYTEFTEDGGYDRRELWSDAGWAWVQQQGRRAPAGVEQLRGGVVVQRGVGAKAQLQRAPAGQPVVHVSRFEAEAWCRWAGRRLPTEPEWEQAAATAASRGFVWGDVFEWVAGSARGWPGCPAGAPGAIDHLPALDLPAGTLGVLRGASFATRTRWHHAKARRFAPPDADTMFCGFRSCGL
jgi:gamma-glutamyl hercynylcysteine S-oxide synthase